MLLVLELTSLDHDVDYKRLQELLTIEQYIVVVEQLQSYINVVDQQVASEDKLTDKNIVAMVCFDFDQSRTTTSNKEVLCPTVTAGEALSALYTLISFKNNLKMVKGSNLKSLICCDAEFVILRFYIMIQKSKQIL